MELKFKEPVLFCDLANDKEAYKPGIYIWGFKYPDNKFIPYYVGKSQSSIVGRIAQHISDIIKIDSTYMRLSYDYMEEFYKDFPDITSNTKDKSKLPAWFTESFKGKIVYLNCLDFLKTWVPDIKKGRDYPISLLKENNRNIPDFLLDKIREVRICYAPFDETLIRKLKGTNKDIEGFKFFEKRNYENIESYVKYSLHGKTVGKSNSFDLKWDNNSGCLVGEVLVSISKDSYSNIFKPEFRPTKKFNGSYE